jgi:hypothetical protein
MSLMYLCGSLIISFLRERGNSICRAGIPICTDYYVMVNTYLAFMLSEASWAGTGHLP